MSQPIDKSARTRLRRLPQRGSFDQATIHSILDEALICHVGFTVNGQPYVIPTGFARVDGDLYIHGSAASRMLRTLGEGVDVCVTVTLLDGLVLARSAFHHSMNYRSVVILGRAELVTNEDEKLIVLEAFSEHTIPGRWRDVRPPTDLELKATSVLKLKITEASAKIRTGPPVDDEEDYDLSVWAGVLPFEMTPRSPIDDEKLVKGIKPPEYVRKYRR